MIGAYIYIAFFSLFQETVGSGVNLDPKKGDLGEDIGNGGLLDSSENFYATVGVRNCFHSFLSFGPYTNRYLNLLFVQNL